MILSTDEHGCKKTDKQSISIHQQLSICVHLWTNSKLSAMLARVYSCAVVGLDGVVVEVEVDTHPGLPKVVVVGLPDAAIQESRERVASAIKNSLLFETKEIKPSSAIPASFS